METATNEDETQTNPQKHMIKVLCKIIYYSGLGDCWYEDTARSPFYKKLYFLWEIICHIYLIAVIVGELAALTRADLTVKEQSDTVQFVTAHPTVYLKFIFVILQRDSIKNFFKKMFEDTRTICTYLDLERAAITRSKWYCFALSFTMFLCLFTSTVDGIIVHFKTGIPMRTIVTYWPTRDDSGLLTNIIRFLIQVYWWYIVFVMVVIDTICFSSMIFLACKFKGLQRYFVELSDDYKDNIGTKTTMELENDMRNNIIVGIQLHSETLWCAQNLQSALGNIYSLQVVQSIGLLVVCLMKLVRVERSLSFLIANLAFIQCMIALTSTYMTAAGDITYEASRLPTAIFHSGWEYCGMSAKLRPLLTISIQRSQVPVVMSAFGVFTLSYSTLIMIMRSSYSFFAVMY